jgi:hypothetical protein
MCSAVERLDSKGAGESPYLRKVEANTMHEAMVSLLFMVIVMFPCFVSMATPE